MKKLLALIVLVVILGVGYMNFGSEMSDTEAVTTEAVTTEAVTTEAVTTEAVTTEAVTTEAVTDVAAADATQGADLYGQYCVGCHGDGAAGLSAFNGELERLQFMLNGGSAYMPDFTGMFTDEDINNIHAYLTSTEEG